MLNFINNTIYFFDMELINTKISILFNEPLEQFEVFNFIFFSFSFLKLKLYLASFLVFFFNFFITALYDHLFLNVVYDNLGNINIKFENYNIDSVFFNTNYNFNESIIYFQDIVNIYVNASKELGVYKYSNYYNNISDFETVTFSLNSDDLYFFFLLFIIFVLFYLIVNNLFVFMPKI